MHLEYPVTLRPMKNGTVMATFVDVPEALTCGRDETEALRLAQEALVLALTKGYMAIRRSGRHPLSQSGDSAPWRCHPWWRLSWRFFRLCWKKG